MYERAIVASMPLLRKGDLQASGGDVCKWALYDDGRAKYVLKLSSREHGSSTHRVARDLLDDAETVARSLLGLQQLQPEPAPAATESAAPEPAAPEPAAPEPAAPELAAPQLPAPRSFLCERGSHNKDNSFGVAPFRSQMLSDNTQYTMHGDGRVSIRTTAFGEQLLQRDIWLRSPHTEMAAVREALEQGPDFFEPMKKAGHTPPSTSQFAARQPSSRQRTDPAPLFGADSSNSGAAAGDALLLATTQLADSAGEESGEEATVEARLGSPVPMQLDDAPRAGAMQLDDAPGTGALCTGWGWGYWAQIQGVTHLLLPCRCWRDGPVGRWVGVANGRRVGGANGRRVGGANGQRVDTRPPLFFPSNQACVALGCFERVEQEGHQKARRHTSWARAQRGRVVLGAWRRPRRGEGRGCSTA